MFYVHQALDGSWKLRKDRLNVTWEQVIQVGIEVLEEEGGKVRDEPSEAIPDKELEQHL